MIYEIIGETIKSATSIKLGQIFGNSKRFKEILLNKLFQIFILFKYL
jgi:hypothetical protein